MPKVPVVAIIGRPNTGKSTLFNRLIRRRVAIESAVAGTTRDHIARKVELEDMQYLLVDTGGMGGGTTDRDFEDDVHAQSLLALEGADVILFTVDAKTDLTKSDQEIVTLLRKKRKRHVPVILVATKNDVPEKMRETEHAFHALGIADDILSVSAAHNRGIDELQETIVGHLKKLHFGGPESHVAESEIGIPRIAIVGRPNVGKSSIVNALMSETQRKLSPKLVSDIPGTTRDATDTLIRNDEQEFILVDTAGLRRKARIEEDLEGLSVLRTMQAIEDADVAVLILEAKESVSNQDKKIAGTIIERGKGLVLMINKIDLLEGEERQEKLAEVRGAFPFCRYAPILVTSAKTRENLPKLFTLSLMVRRNMALRIAPSELNRFLRDVIAGHPMTALKSCKHMTQAKDPPPTFVLFVRNPDKVQPSQMRYLENRLRERFGLDGVPVKWVLKGGSRRR